jgi:hypothetical protein
LNPWDGAIILKNSVYDVWHIIGCCYRLFVCVCKASCIHTPSKSSLHTHLSSTQSPWLIPEQSRTQAPWDKSTTPTIINNTSCAKCGGMSACIRHRSSSTPLRPNDVWFVRPFASSPKPSLWRHQHQNSATTAQQTVFRAIMIAVVQIAAILLYVCFVHAEVCQQWTRATDNQHALQEPQLLFDATYLNFTFDTQTQMDEYFQNKYYENWCVRNNTHTESSNNYVLWYY